MRRVWPLQLLLVLVAAGGAGLVWLTHHPEAPILERAATWPVVGPVAEKIRRIYLPPEERPAPVPAPSPAPVVVKRRSSPEAPAAPRAGTETFEAQPFEWFRAGAEVHEAPDASSPVLLRLDNPARFALFEQRGDWARIRVGSRPAWIRVGTETVSPDPPLGRAPVPVLPVPGRPPDPVRLAQARSLLEPPKAEGRLGPYRLTTDVRDEALLAFLDKVARHHGEAHRQRYGLSAVGEPAAVIVLFARRDDYRRFQQAEAGLEELRAAGHSGSGIIALAAEGTPRELVAAILVHELTHVVNRRSIGPALPPWLEEGLAEDLGGSRLDADGRLLPGSVQESRTVDGARIELAGFGASLELLRSALEEGRLIRLPRLVETDWEGFVASGRLALHYAESGMLIRFLLAPETGYRGRFRAFLLSVSRGGSATPEALREHLGSTWSDLDERFRGWLTLRLASRAAVTRP